MTAAPVTVEELRSIGHDCSLPLEQVIPLQGESSELCCRRLVRSIPGKRLVFQAEWQGRDVFAKVFLDAATAQRDVRQEQQGSEALTRAGIDTPELLYSGALGDDAYVLIYALVPDAVTFQQAWRIAADDKAIRLELVERMYQVLAAHHNAGLLHRDPHQKNFLIAGNILYTLDCADIDILRRPPGKTRALENLATFFAILHADSDELVATAYPLYCQARGYEYSDKELTVLLAMTGKRRQQSREQYLAKKIFRDCTEFVCKKQKGRYVVYRRDRENDALREFVDSPDAYMEKHLDQYLKQGRSSTVAVVRFADRLYVVKRYNIKNPWKAMTHALGRTRARHSWINAHRLVINGIRTALPVILIENRFGPVNLTSYFVSEYIAGVNIEDYLLTLSGNSSKRSEMVQKIGSLFQVLHFHKLSHGDMKASNIIIDNDEPYLMDLDSMRKHSIDKTFASRHSRDKQRFLRNWVNNEHALTDFRQALQIQR